MKKLIEFSLVALVCGVCGTSSAFDFPMGDTLRSERLKPRGDRYETNVPETLHLTERANLSVQALTRLLNPRKAFGPYGIGDFNVRVPYMTSKSGGGEGSLNWRKDSIPPSFSTSSSPF
jgi:hypothetical protein